MRTSVPENTIFETDPQYAGMEPKAIKFMKLILLTFADMHNLQNDFDMTDTEIINDIIILKQRGAITIVMNEFNEIRLIVTPTGAAKAWLSRFR
jgi:hypothetical protein